MFTWARRALRCIRDDRLEKHDCESNESKDKLDRMLQLLEQQKK